MLNANLSLSFFILFLGLLNSWFLHDALRYKFYLISHGNLYYCFFIFYLGVGFQSVSLSDIEFL